MSVKRDPLLIGLYAFIITMLVSTASAAAPYVSLGPLSFIVNPYIWLFNALVSMKGSVSGIASSGLVLAVVSVFLAAYAALFVLYLVSWGITRTGREFIRAWGRDGGPDVGLPTTVGYCIPASVLCLIAWWLCPVNHHPLTNLAYNLQLMRLRPIAVLVVVLSGAIPGAALSGHYRDVCDKILEDYPY